jgi:cytochrome oxidase Cu insertion factor (SCO1/SenC/PrrC family)
MKPVSRGGRHFWQGLVAILAAAAMVGAAVAWRVGLPGALFGTTLPEAAVAALAQDGMTPVTLPAPNFTLRDQRGQVVSLRTFRGRVVVLTFLDPVCWDQCPLQAADMKAMLQLLPPGERRDVALVAVAANPVVHSEAALRAFDEEVGLSRTPEWYFLTAPHVATLKRVWRAYYVTVLVPRDGMVQHSQVYYLIGRHGRVRYISMPTDTAGLFKGTAELLAAYVEKLLGPEPAPIGPAPAWREAFWGRLTPEGNLTRIVWVRQGLTGWRIVARGGYVTLQFTTNGGRAWRDVSPPGVSKRGGLLAAFGPGLAAWVMVLPWGYDHTPVSFYTDDGGQSWSAPVVWPAGCLATPVGQPLAAAPGNRAYLLDREGLWQATGGGPWVRVARPPSGWMAVGPVTVRWSGGVVVESPDGTWIWRPGAGWAPTRTAT